MDRTTFSNGCLVLVDLSWMLSYQKMPNVDSSNLNISHNLSKHSEIGGIEAIVLYQKKTLSVLESSILALFLI